MRGLRSLGLGIVLTGCSTILSLPDEPEPVLAGDASAGGMASETGTTETSTAETSMPDAAGDGPVPMPGDAAPDGPCVGGCPAGTTCQPDGSCQVAGQPTCGQAQTLGTAGGRYKGKVCQGQSALITMCQSEMRFAHVFVVPASATFTKVTVAAGSDGTIYLRVPSACGAGGVGCSSILANDSQSQTGLVPGSIIEIGGYNTGCYNYALSFTP